MFLRSFPAVGGGFRPTRRGIIKSLNRYQGVLQVAAQEYAASSCAGTPVAATVSRGGDRRGGSVCRPFCPPPPSHNRCWLRSALPATSPWDGGGARRAFAICCVFYGCGKRLTLSSQCWFVERNTMVMFYVCTMYYVW